MKAQYVGDIGDFGKVLLLKHLAGLGFRIGVKWVLTENDATADGRHRAYIDYRGVDCLSGCDPVILAGMASFATKPKELRSVSDLEDLIHSFAKEAKFNSAIYADQATKNQRDEFDKEAFSKLDSANLVFFDPGNGFDGEKGLSAKHVYLDDLDRYWRRSQSLLVYHHLSRNGGHGEQVGALKQQLQRHFSSGQVKSYHFRRGTARVYILVLQPDFIGRVPDPEEVESTAPLLVSKGEWTSARRGQEISCRENHSWYLANQEAPPLSPSPRVPCRA
jgi:hypothetical protein